MPYTFPLSQSALQDVHDLSLRFSKHLEELGGPRIRGTGLKDAFARVAGYRDNNEAVNQSGRIQASFDYDAYVQPSGRIIRKYLPEVVDAHLIEEALSKAKRQGSFIVTLDTHSCGTGSDHNPPYFIARILTQRSGEL